ncbi:hypothetical protein LUPAC06_05344 [Micromonospora saelicesensis]|nr:hypothetical protein LUPAC06_05344 [Micromonospora saelicesensis]
MAGVRGRWLARREGGPSMWIFGSLGYEIATRSNLSPLIPSGTRIPNTKTLVNAITVSGNPSGTTTVDKSVVTSAVG